MPTIEITNEEFKTRELCAVSSKENGTAIHMIKMVFKIMWHCSLTVDRIEQIGTAVYIVVFSTADIKKALSTLVRKKVLRTRRAEGKTLYEVNY